MSGAEAKKGRAVYSVRCPIHPEQEIGEWSAEVPEPYHGGYWCPKCKKMIRFNASNFKKLLTNEYFPLKIL